MIIKSIDQLLSSENEIFIIRGHRNTAKLHLFLLRMKLQGEIPRNFKIVAVDEQPFDTKIFRLKLGKYLLSHGFTVLEVEQYLQFVYYHRETNKKWWDYFDGSTIFLLIKLLMIIIHLFNS